MSILSQVSLLKRERKKTNHVLELKKKIWTALASVDFPWPCPAVFPVSPPKHCKQTRCTSCFCLSNRMYLRWAHSTDIESESANVQSLCRRTIKFQSNSYFGTKMETCLLEAVKFYLAWAQVFLWGPCRMGGWQYLNDGGAEAQATLDFYLDFFLFI